LGDPCLRSAAGPYWPLDEEGNTAAGA
jgi:hypothetical protein